MKIHNAVCLINDPPSNRQLNNSFRLIIEKKEKIIGRWKKLIKTEEGSEGTSY